MNNPMSDDKLLEFFGKDQSTGVYDDYVVIDAGGNEVTIGKVRARVKGDKSEGEKASTVEVTIASDTSTDTHTDEPAPPAAADEPAPSDKPSVTADEPKPE